MKLFFSRILIAFPVITIMLTITGCVKDSCMRTYTYTYYEPVYRTTDEVKANIKSSPAVEIQNPGKLYILGNYIFLNEIDKGIHIIDNSTPASPVNKAFINIPGNIDIAVKGNILYADLYTDLVTIDISDPLNATVKKYNEGVFPFRSYGNGLPINSTGKIIVDWIKKDTIVTHDCSQYSLWQAGDGAFFMSTTGGKGDLRSVSPVGLAGSTARFSLINNRMYSVSYTDLNVFDISTPANPELSNRIKMMNTNIETIFPFKGNLFIGSQNGMFIYSLNNPDFPSLTGQFVHAESCDPVIADDDYAYVTLRSGTQCRTITQNQLDILRLNNNGNPQLVKSYSLTNPHGLSKDGNLLFICDGKAGLKIFDASDVLNLKLIKEFNSIETYEVITYNKIALVVAKNGLYQYDYSNQADIRLISKIDVNKQ